MSERDAELPVFQRLGLEVVSGQGAVLRTADGGELLDFYGGHAVALLGHGHPGLTEAIARQAETLLFQSNLVDVPVRRRAAARLAAFAPAGLDSVFLVNSGAEANENALRIAFKLTRRRKVVVLDEGFHGRTAAAAACTAGSAKWYAFPRLPFEVVRVPPGDARLLDEAVDDDVAAVLLEPVQGLAGAVALEPDYLWRVRRLTEARGTVWIADEVQCGMGRTGRNFAVDHAGTVPDILTTAKGLGGGVPCAAVICRPSVMEHLAVGDLGTTFGGSPLACAAIEAVLDVLEGPGFLDTVRERGQQLREWCLGAGPVQAVQGAGLLLGLRCSRPAREVQAELLAAGILVGTSRDPMVIRLMPPLILEERHAARLRDALQELPP